MHSVVVKDIALADLETDAASMASQGYTVLKSVSTNKGAKVIYDKQSFVGSIVNQTINSGGSVTRFSVNISGAPDQLGVNCKIQNIKFSTTTNPNADLSLYIIDPTDFGSVALVDVGYLSGQNVTNAVIWPESTGYPNINAGTAPYTGNFDTIDPYSIWDGIDPNGTWSVDVYMEGAGGNTLDELVLTIIPI
jgi:hypothetical protein